MSVEGYCLTEQRDVPVDGRAYCLADGSLTIPPTYGDRFQTWVDGAWFPEVVRRPRVNAARFVPTRKTLTQRQIENQRSRLVDVACKHCQRVTQRPNYYRAMFCNDTCRKTFEKAARQRRQPPTMCPTCAVVFTPLLRPGGGIPSRYCSDNCRKRADKQRCREHQRGAA